MDASAAAILFPRRQVCNGYNGVMQAASRIAREEGLAVFTRGVGARIAWVRCGEETGKEEG